MAIWYLQIAPRDNSTQKGMRKKRKKKEEKKKP